MYTYIYIINIYIHTYTNLLPKELCVNLKLQVHDRDRNDRQKCHNLNYT